jgi:hypothetical protein
MHGRSSAATLNALPHLKGTVMDFWSNFWDILVWTFWVFIWISAIVIWVRCIFDLFSDKSLGVGAKVGWAILLIFVPWFGAFIYLIARGRSMGERQAAAAQQQRAAQDDYIRSIAGAPATPAEQIANAKQLLDSGAINQAEFDSMKAKALA